jgi:potassium efflux system protein
MSLGMRLRATLWVILAAVVLHAVLERWLLVVRRRLAIEHARRQRSPAAPADGEQHTKIDATDDEAGSADPSSELRADLATLSDQTRQILRSLVTFGGLVCLWFIWVEMVPALAVLDQIRVWSTVTLADLGLTAVILLLTFIAARNIPGFLEITLLQRLPLDSGQRFATTAIGRYAIIVIGVVAAFNALGVAWNDVQWLVAAMTVGLGFGLQEIFANFVSGLIILFERPVRVGDVITIGNVTGTVTKIQIRATTVMDWDRKELVVPNKEFLTGHVVNWSLPDEKLRLVIKLGVAYGSDTRLVRRILLDVAGRNPRVAKDPPPQVWFNEFGDSALNFELRVVVRGLDDYMLVQHQLHTAIDDAFREAKITIPFPQRQVHVLGERSSAGELQDAKAD